MPSFSFINTSFLLLIPLVALPVLIHLISKKNRKIIKYPSLKFIREAYLKKARRMRINEILLLIIRTLITAIIIFAFARLIMFTADNSPAAGLKYAIIIDSSYSTSGAAGASSLKSGEGNYFDNIKSRSTEIIKNVTNSPLFVIIDSGEPYKESEFLDGGRAAEYIKKINHSYRPFSITAIIDILKRKEYYNDLTGIYVFSDFITSVQGEDARLNARIENAPELKKGPRYELFNCGPLSIRINKNLSIISARPADERIAAGKPFQIICRVKNHSLHRMSSEVSLIAENTRIASTPFAAEAGEICDVFINHTFMNSGDYALRLKLDDDAADFDNSYNLVISPLASLYMLILCEHDSSLHEDFAYKYVSAALNPLNAISIKDGLIIQPLITNLAGNPPLDFKNFDALIISGIKTPSAELAARIEKYVNAGGGVLFLPPDGAYLKEFSRAFARLLPLDLSSSTPVSSPDEKNHFNLCNINYDHDIFNIFKNRSSGDIEKPEFYKIIPCGPHSKTDPDVSIIASFEREIPALAEKKSGHGTVLLFTGYLDRGGSNLPQSPLFVPFIHQTAYYINKNRSANRRAYTIGDTIREYYNITEKISGVSAIGPDSKFEKKLDIKTSAEGLFSELTDTFTPGVYTLFKKSEERITKKLFAVNYDARESELITSDYNAIAAALDRHSLLKFSGSTAQEFKSEKKTELTAYLFMLILLLMAIESYLTYKIKNI